MKDLSYPLSWPLPNPDKPKSLITIITDEQKADLYHRRITTRELASVLKVRESYLSHLYPGKVEVVTGNKRVLLESRKLFRYMQAAKVVKKEITIAEAATLSRISYRSMARAVQFIKRGGNPHTAPPALDTELLPIGTIVKDNFRAILPEGYEYAPKPIGSKGVSTDTIEDREGKPERLAILTVGTTGKTLEGVNDSEATLEDLLGETNVQVQED